MSESEEVFNASLIYRKDLTDELSIVRVVGDDNYVPEFKAGQFVTLGLPRALEEIPEAARAKMGNRPRLVRRAYSIASSPKQREFLELYVVLVEGGKLTPKLWTVDEGGRLYMDPRIKGEFTLDEVPADKDIVMIATGTGIAPFISMLRTYRNENRWRQCTLIHGVRRPEHLGFSEELEEAVRQDSTFHYIPVCSDVQTPQVWGGTRGRVQVALNEEKFRELTGGTLDPQQCHVFLCGNPAMINDVETLLHERGFKTHSKDEPGNIHFERYW